MKTKTPADGNKKLDVENNELETLNLPDEDEELEKQPAPVNPRDAMMADVVASSVKTREEAYREEGLEPPGNEAAVVDELEIEEPEPEIIPADPEVVDILEESNDTEIVQRDGKSFIRVKVDGVEKEVPVEDMVTHYQKNENADAKLGQANRILTQARTLQQSPASTLPDDSSRPVVDETAVNAAFNKLYDGEVEEAAKDFSKLISNQSSPQVDIDALVERKIDERADHKDLTSSFDRFKSNEDFKHIVSDPTLMSKVDGFTVALQQDSAFMATNPSYEDIFTEAGKRTDEWLQGIAPSTATDQIIEEQRERKRTKPKSVNSRTARRGPKAEVKVATREDNIAKMAKARGQTIY